MFGRKLVSFEMVGSAVLLGMSALSAQPPLKASAAPALEFPVFMRQNVVAGKTPVGTPIKAKLSVATLVHSVVIPQGAILAGEVTESAGKSSTEPSRLAIRLDSARWQTGTRPMSLEFPSKVYLTPWYYPLEIVPPPDSPDSLQNRPVGPRHRGGGTYPNPNPSDSPPYVRGTTDSGNDSASATSGARLSEHRVLMKDVETSATEGSIVLSSERSNIRLDKSTTYVFATVGLVPSR